MAKILTYCKYANAMSKPLEEKKKEGPSEENPHGPTCEELLIIKLTLGDPGNVTKIGSKIRTFPGIRGDPTRYRGQGSHDPGWTWDPLPTSMKCNH
ncbi:UNVERIFIED_CONTAM: hypothetical protein Sangu_1324900 [Sesamum angustifolium]|uniref:Uncharacterized protein n=1 Tax=Sesamum angustifolium TaxID=2727405 RepID=A0AAW2NLN2_9LAMI